MNKLLAILLLALSLPALAALEVAGVKFDDKAKVGAGDTVINGAGMRKRAFFKVYAIGLYLPQKAATAADALNAKGAKRIAIVTLRELTAEQFVDALIEALKNNHDEAAMKLLQPRVDQFRSTMLTIGNAPEKSVVQLDWLPETGTRLTFNGAQKGADIAGEDFYRALLRIWLGDKPAQDDLKEQLLGKAAG
ncbi:MAG: chalcone isomerase family protein [Rhodocyclales bacterium]|nr:chalcone isomerase family protein [Rhodocyclales bacterium]